MAEKWTWHPVYRFPTAEESQAMGPERWMQVMRDREEMILREKEDPLRFGWEPPIWMVCDCLMGFPWVDRALGERVRKRLGLKRPWRILLINGGQRGTKSEYAAKRVMMLLNGYERMRAWAFHESQEMSVQYQQRLFRKYFTPELRNKQIKSATTYIAWKDKTGFSENAFILPWGSDCSFRTYGSDKANIEGGNVDVIAPDEKVPSDWVETMTLRIAEKDGWILVTFTPIWGYSDTVQMFHDGAKLLRESVGYLLPQDGKEPDVARAMGLTDAEYQEALADIEGMERERRAPRKIQCRPERFEDLVQEGEGGQGGVGLPSSGAEAPPSPAGGRRDLDVRHVGMMPAGRKFERVPRIMKCADPSEKRGVVFFHSSDNPFGNPLNVWATIRKGSRDFHKERFYGVATKLATARFPRFEQSVHLIPRAMIPKEGTDYLFVDPCSGRNFFALWMRSTTEGDFVVDEWPSQVREIPGVGVLGPWALPDGKKHDGRRGEGQRSLGWGLLQYKIEIARIEGWPEWETWFYGRKREQGGEKGQGGEGAALTPALSRERERERDGRGGSDPRTWQAPRNGVYERFLDSRFGNTKSFEEEGMVTLIEEFEDIGLQFYPTTGGDTRESIGEGVQLINDALYYDQERPIGFLNKPRLHICDECLNLIFAMTTWTGLDGAEGATKDPIDCLRYFYLKSCGFVKPGGGDVAGRGCY